MYGEHGKVCQGSYQKQDLDGEISGGNYHVACAWGGTLIRNRTCKYQMMMS